MNAFVLLDTADKLTDAGNGQLIIATIGTIAMWAAWGAAIAALVFLALGLLGLRHARAVEVSRPQAERVPATA